MEGMDKQWLLPQISMMVRQIIVIVVPQFGRMTPLMMRILPQILWTLPMMITSSTKLGLWEAIPRPSRGSIRSL
jgi:uncharacterized membrane protein